ncbi:MAG: hypothetical protein ACFFFC_17305 [Candidatus Thorarchaeota archaeon]
MKDIVEEEWEGYEQGETIHFSTDYLNLEAIDGVWVSDPDRHIRRYIRRQLLGGAGFDSCVHSLMKEFNLSRETSVNYLERFIGKLLDWVPSKLDNAFIAEQIALFVSELNNNPVEWRVEAWLEGIVIEPEKLELDDGMILRRLTEEELKSVKSFVSIYPDISISPKAPSCALEFKKKAKSTEEVQPGINRLLNTLRLFQLGSIGAVRIRYSPQSIIRPRLSTGGMSFGKPYKYQLREMDKNQLHEFIELFPPIFEQLENIESKKTHLRVAVQRYNDALLHSEAIEQRITLAITCLEALLLKTREREGLSRRLAQRLALLLELAGFDVNRVFESTLRAYNIRSDYIHGGEIDDQDLEKAPELCKEMLNFARVALQMLLQRLEEDKVKIIEFMDKALLDDSFGKKLRKVFADIVLQTE